MDSFRSILFDHFPHSGETQAALFSTIMKSVKGKTACLEEKTILVEEVYLVEEHVYPSTNLKIPFYKKNVQEHGKY